jgi:hypothetical protein
MYLFLLEICMSYIAQIWWLKERHTEFQNIKQIIKDLNQFH